MRYWEFNRNCAKTITASILQAFSQRLYIMQQEIGFYPLEKSAEKLFRTQKRKKSSTGHMLSSESSYEKYFTPFLIR